MEYDLDYFVQTAIEAGRFDPSLNNPYSNIAVSYGDGILKAARKYGYAQVEGLKIDVDDLDGFQYFTVNGEEVTTTKWQEELLALLTKAFDKACID